MELNGARRRRLDAYPDTGSTNCIHQVRRVVIVFVGQPRFAFVLWGSLSAMAGEINEVEIDDISDFEATHFLLLEAHQEGRIDDEELLLLTLALEEDEDDADEARNREEVRPPEERFDLQEASEAACLAMFR